MSATLATAASARPSIISISAGDHHACAIDKNGVTYCWGDNTLGGSSIRFSGTNQLWGVRQGNTQFGALGSAVQAAAGSYHTCVLHSHSATTSTITCWGDASFGQQGYGAAPFRCGDQPSTGRCDDQGDLADERIGAREQGFDPAQRASRSAKAASSNTTRVPSSVAR